MCVCVCITEATLIKSLYYVTLYIVFFPFDVRVYYFIIKRVGNARRDLSNRLNAGCYARRRRSCGVVITLCGRKSGPEMTNGKRLYIYTDRDVPINSFVRNTGGACVRVSVLTHSFIPTKRL